MRLTKEEKEREKRERGRKKEMSSVGETLALILTNLAILPASIITIRFGDIPTFTMTIIMLIISSFYHLCLAEVWCVAPLRLLQACDHLSVCAIIVWLFLLIMYNNLDIQFSIFLVVFISLIVMTPFLLNSLIVEITVAIFIVFAALAQVMIFEKKLKPFEILFVIIVAIIFGSAVVLFVIGGDVDSDLYKILHPIWHVLAMLGLIPLLFLTYGISLTDIYLWCTNKQKKT